MFRVSSQQQQREAIHEQAQKVLVGDSRGCRRRFLSLDDETQKADGERHSRILPGIPETIGQPGRSHELVGIVAEERVQRQRCKTANCQQLRSTLKSLSRESPC